MIEGRIETEKGAYLGGWGRLPPRAGADAGAASERDIGLRAAGLCGLHWLAACCLPTCLRYLTCLLALQAKPDSKDEGVDGCVLGEERIGAYSLHFLRRLKVPYNTEAGAEVRKSWVSR
jgi:hypothetical protein